MHKINAHNYAVAVQGYDDWKYPNNLEDTHRMIDNVKQYGDMTPVYSLCLKRPPRIVSWKLLLSFTILSMSCYWNSWGICGTSP